MNGVYIKYKTGLKRIKQIIKLFTVLKISNQDS